MEARVVHLQLQSALEAQRLCILYLHISQERPWLVTPFRASRHTLQNVGRACEQTYQLWAPMRRSFCEGGGGCLEETLSAWIHSSILDWVGEGGCG